MGANAAMKKLGTLPIHSMIRNGSLPIYLLLLKFKVQIKSNSSGQLFGAKSATNGRLLKVALISGFISIIGIILILLMLLFGFMQ